MSNILLTPGEQEYIAIMEDLNAPIGDGLLVVLKHRLHDKQIEALQSYYRDNKQLLFIPCARKFGKSELAAYVLYRHALFNPNSVCYYICPENSQGRKIIWDTQRLQKFMGKATSKYIKSINNTEMKITFYNDAIIQVIGSDNWAAANGLTPSITVYDEFKIFNPKWHTEYDPNRAAKGSPLIIIGTMPKIGDSNKAEYEQILEYAKNDAECAVHIYTTWDNPINHLPDRKRAIEQQIKILRARGEEDVVQREYYSRIVPGGTKAIFPMLDKELHVKKHDSLLNKLYRDRTKLEWFVVADPGTTTCFAVLFGCINPYTKRVYILDEIYEKDQRQTSTRNMFPRLHLITGQLYEGSSIDDDWNKTVDEAAAWFINEVMDQYGVYFNPTAKYVNKKENGISLIKDLLLTGLVEISDKCPHLFKEMQEYCKDENGEIPKKKGVNDHLIDCLRYLLGSANYTSVEDVEIITPKDPEVDFKDALRSGLPSRYIDDKEDDNDWDKGYDWL